MMDSHNKTVSGFITLHNGTTISRDFYSRVLAATLVGFATMPTGKPMTLRKICGKEFWLTLHSSETSLAGFCGVTMVSKGDVMLTLAGKDGKNAQRYLKE